MNKIVWGWDGVVARRELARQAHVKWFDFMVSELGDESLRKYQGSSDYYKHVLEIMERWLGVSIEENGLLMNVIARNLYESFYLSETGRGRRVWPGIKETMEKLDERGYENFIVSGTPNEATKAIVRSEGLLVNDENILASRIMERPKGKDKFLIDLVEQRGKPRIYVGEGVKDIRSAKELGIYAALASWDKTPDYTGVYRPEELLEASELADVVVEHPGDVLELVK